MSLRRMTFWSDEFVGWGLLALIVYTPLAFGSVEAWAMALLEWGIWTLVLAAAFAAALRGESITSGWRSTGLEVPLLLFILYCLAQTVPLPGSVLRVVSPGAASMYAVSALPDPRGLDVPADLEAPGSLLHPESSPRRPVSVSPHATRQQLLLLVSLTALFFLVARWAAVNGRARFLAVGVAVTAFLVSLFGLVQHLTWNGRIYWFRRVSSASAFGPFVNHNHFAGYVGMVIPIAVCLAFAVTERRHRGDSDEFAFDRWGRAGLAFYGAVVLVVALFFSLSRGGILSSAVSGLLLFALVARRMESRVLVWATAAILVVVVVGLIAWIGADVVSHQIMTYRTAGNEASFQSRIMVWRAMIDRLDSFLWTGSGLGTFEDSFAPFTPPGSSRRWDRAHNDYLQLVWETGVVGSVLVLAGSVVFLRRYWWPALRARGEQDSLLRVGLAVSFLSIALHSLIDFNLQIGSNAFLFTLLAGILVALHRLPDERPPAPAVTLVEPAPAAEPVVAGDGGSA